MGKQDPLLSPGVSRRGQTAQTATALTLGGAVREEGHQQGYIVNVLQVRSHLVDAPGQLGLEKAEMTLPLNSGLGEKGHSQLPRLPQSIM